jgi:hypothetical protein
MADNAAFLHGTVFTCIYVQFVQTNLSYISFHAAKLIFNFRHCSNMSCPKLTVATYVPFVHSRISVRIYSILPLAADTNLKG